MLSLYPKTTLIWLIDPLTLLRYKYILSFGTHKYPHNTGPVYTQGQPWQLKTQHMQMKSVFGYKCVFGNNLPWICDMLFPNRFSLPIVAYQFSLQLVVLSCLGFHCIIIEYPFCNHSRQNINRRWLGILLLFILLLANKHKTRFSKDSAK